ncbi:sugar ABC transporter substrate-binding protein [Microbacterium sp.]|uniref:ABC transporter substrate-binding protein n=1 Tax=Microbacterium sp. TaxID=51671 RepID=UPI0028ABC8C3|nr:sugar ABC transporter substrate-binding protein [Microbacterium sp.]
MRSMRSGIGVGIIVGALMLTSCSSGGTTGGGEVDTSLDPAEISGKLSYAIWDVNQQPGMEALIDDFNKTYPNVKVKVEVTAYAQYFTKLQTQASSGTLPEVFWMNGPNFQLFASNDMLAPLSPLVEADMLDTSKYPEALNSMYSLGDEQYSVPKDFDTIAVYYNREILERAGLEEPTSDWTWDDYRAMANQITDRLGSEGIIGTGENYDNQPMLYPAIVSNGGSIIKDGKSGYDDPKTIEAIQFWRDMVADGAMLTPAQNADTTGTQRFLNGQAGMVWSGTWQVAPLLDSVVKDKIGVVELPLSPSGDRQTVIHGIGNSMSAKAASDPAAQAFLAYLGSEKAALIQAEMGTANPAYEETQQAFVDSAPDYNLEIFLEAADQYAQPYPISKNTSAWNKFETELLPEAFSGDRPVDEVAQELAEKMNEALGKEK